MNIFLDVLYTVGLILWYYVEAVISLLTPPSFKREKSVAGKTAVVTGAGQGLGRLISIGLASKGARVVLWDINLKGLKETKAIIERNGGEAFVYECNVADRSAVYDTANSVRRDVGEVYLLVNNAGIVNGKWLLDTPDDQVQRVMDVNATAHFWTLKAFLPHMIAVNDGHIVTISSIAGKTPCPKLVDYCAGKTPCPKLVDYCASKYAAVGLHESLAIELRAMKKTGIHLTNICPFFINTGMFGGCRMKFQPMLQPEQVANRVVQATLRNEHEVILPTIYDTLLRLTGLFPRKAVGAIEDLSGVGGFMDTFTGHTNGRSK